jgi:peptidoglycan/LPS O-acetylase OafA/YrhL
VNANLRYRREIDGLRALAVVPVILFHAGVNGFNGGYVGVDIFFVLSGYLITSLVASEMEGGKFSLLDFYERRIRRIFPALFFVTMCCVLPSMYWMFPEELRKFANSMIAVAYLGSNFFLSRKAGYFDGGTDAYPLMHTWSLAVEEQFYLLFPLFIMLTWRFGRRNLAVIISILALTSLGLAEWGWREFPKANFYLLPGRAWELMLGSLAALYLQRWQPQSQNLNNALSLLGVILIIGSVLAFDADTPFPSFYTLVPTMGTVLIIVFASPRTLANRLFSTPFMVGIGLISYSTYLWHQPLFAFLRIQSLQEPSQFAFLLLALVSFCLALFSWRFVERPFRDRSRLSRSTVYVSFVALTLLLIGSGLLLKTAREELSRPNSIVRAKYFSSFSSDRNPDFGRCQGDDDHDLPPEKSCVYGNKASATIAILGDSHANAFANVLGEALSKEGLGLRELSFSGCVPIRGLRRNDDSGARKCEKYNNLVFEYVKKHHEIETIVLISRWTQYLVGSPFDNGEGGREDNGNVYVLPAGVDVHSILPDQRQAFVSKAYIEGVKAFLGLGRKVILIYPEPEVGWNVPQYLAREVLNGISRDGPLTTDLKVFEQRNSAVFSAFNSIGDDLNLKRVYPSELLCDSYLKGKCIAQLDGIPLYSDDDHLGSMGAKLVVNEIMTFIDK